MLACSQLELKHVLSFIDNAAALKTKGMCGRNILRVRDVPASTKELLPVKTRHLLEFVGEDFRDEVLPFHSLTPILLDMFWCRERPLRHEALGGYV